MTVGSAVGRTRRIARVVTSAATVVVAATLLASCSAASSTGTGGGSDGGGNATLQVEMNPPPNGPYHDRQTISVSVKPNSYFTKYIRVEIIECADPGGLLSKLPTSSLTCDGTTGNTPLAVGADGSFSIPNYVIYSLPNAALAESPDGEPVCNLTHECVLYVGLDYNDFSQPHLFSKPFTVKPGPGSTPR